MLIKVAFVITARLKREENGLVPALLFFIFVAVVIWCTFALCYSLPSSGERRRTRRCRRPHEMYRRRKARRQRTRCRFEG